MAIGCLVLELMFEWLLGVEGAEVLWCATRNLSHLRYLSMTRFLFSKKGSTKRGAPRIPIYLPNFFEKRE